MRRLIKLELGLIVDGHQGLLLPISDPVFLIIFLQFWHIDFWLLLKFVDCIQLVCCYVLVVIEQSVLIVVEVNWPKWITHELVGIREVERVLISHGELTSRRDQLSVPVIAALDDLVLVFRHHGFPLIVIVRLRALLGLQIWNLLYLQNAFQRACTAILRRVVCRELLKFRFKPLELLLIKSVHGLHQVLEMDLLYGLDRLLVLIRWKLDNWIFLVLWIRIILQFLGYSLLHLLQIHLIFKLNLKSQIQARLVELFFISILGHYLAHFFRPLPAFDLLRRLDFFVLLQEEAGQARNPQHLLQTCDQFCLLIDFLLQLCDCQHVQISLNVSIMDQLLFLITKCFLQLFDISISLMYFGKKLLAKLFEFLFMSSNFLVLLLNKFFAS